MGAPIMRLVYVCQNVTVESVLWQRANKPTTRVFSTRRFGKHDSLCARNIKRLRSPIEISLVARNIQVRSLTYILVLNT